MPKKHDDLATALAETAEEIRSALAELEAAAGEAPTGRRAEALVSLNKVANQLAVLKKKLSPAKK